MRVPAGIAALRIAAGLAVVSSHADARQAHVYLRSSVSAYAEHEQRLQAELRRDGYSVARQERGGSWPCDATSSLPETGERTAWLDLELDPARAELVVHICHLEPGGAPERASLRAPANDPRRLAILTVEALNGLGAEVLAPPPAPRAATSSRARPPAPAQTRGGSAVFAQAALVSNAGGGRPLAGLTAGLQTSLHGPWLLEMETFVPLRETSATGQDRELSLGAGWARLGPGAAWHVAPLRLGLSLQAGASFVRASATTTPPLIGTTESTAVAIVSGGVSLECPDTSLIYLRAAARASRLVPAIDLELGDGAARRFGELLLETQIGLGVRWDVVR